MGLNLVKEIVSWVAAFKEGKVLAPLIFLGSIESKAFLVVRLPHRFAAASRLFETWLEIGLIPQLQPRDIIIDNATLFTKKSRLVKKSVVIIYQCLYLYRSGGI